MTDLLAGAPARQPWLHRLCISVDGNATALAAPSGDFERGTPQGLYVDDVRVLAVARLRINGEPPVLVAEAASGAQAEFFLSARNIGDAGVDPTVEVLRRRVLDDGVMVERIIITSRALSPVRARLELELAADGASIAAVKAGHLDHPMVVPRHDGGVLTFVLERHTTTAVVEPAPHDVRTSSEGVLLTTDVTIEPGESTTVTLRVQARRETASALDADAGHDLVDWDDVRVVSDDPRVSHLVRHSVDDLRHLLLRDPQEPGDAFAAAGTPWYLTLFGRDSVWAARMMLPFGTDLAGGTLRALARRQGRGSDPESAEEPGKIAHEVRRTAYVDPESGMALPPLYFGTVDATALWVALLVDAWRWGLPEDQVRALLPSLRAALDWVTGPGQPDDDGLLKYLDTSGHGLANQGWKDSGDSMRRRDGTVAEAPIALVEAQAYAVEALLGAADLLESLGQDGAERAREDGTALRQRVNERFWVEGPQGRYLAMALDGSGKPVDGLGSNMGHVLGTGVLDAQQARAVASVVTGAELLDEFGVRTLGTGNGGFNPIGYHTGSIWTHDTAVVALGLAREGLAREAGTVARTLVASGEAFDYRWPELYSGQPMMGRPSPYPASCRPQAWSAASAGALVTVALGLRADLPQRRLHVAPLSPGPFGALTVSGIKVGRNTVTVHAGRDGSVEVIGVPDGVDVVTGPA